MYNNHSTVSKNIQKRFNSFGALLSYAIDFIGHIPASFSDLFKIDKGQLSNYINNHTTPRPQTIKRFEHWLGLRIAKRGKEWILFIPADAQDLPGRLDQAESDISDLRKPEGESRDDEITEDDLPVLIRLRRKYPELRHVIGKEIERLLNDDPET